jgi:hypothetical protein
MKKKALLLVSFALATVLVVGQAGLAAESEEKTPNQGMMNGNGMSGMMNSNGMSGMMQNENMGKMMDAMNTPEGQEMVESCGNFMESYGDEETEAENTKLQEESA